MKKFTLLVFCLTILSFQAQAGNLSYTCFAGKLDKISVIGNRILTKCVPTSENPAFVKDLPYASASMDQKGAELMFQLLLKGKELNKNILFYIDEDHKTNPAGCDPGNCRRLVGVTLE